MILLRHINPPNSIDAHANRKLKRLLAALGTAKRHPTAATHIIYAHNAMIGPVGDIDSRLLAGIRRCYRLRLAATANDCRRRNTKYDEPLVGPLHEINST